MEQKKEITINDLAGLVKSGFETSGKRTDAKIDKLAAEVKSGFEASDKRTDVKIENLAIKIEALEKRVDAKFDKFESVMRAGFEASDKRVDVKIDKLAEMVGRGFNEMGERMNVMDNNISLLKQGYERIEMRLMNVVYRSELDAVVDRVQILERQMKAVLER
ncbi:MAG: hypothetical protein WCX69_04485 [Candidatus Paceibacterota bacterium]